jgi:hypothetical protein
LLKSDSKRVFSNSLSVPGLLDEIKRLDGDVLHRVRLSRWRVQSRPWRFVAVDRLAGSAASAARAVWVAWSAADWQGWRRLPRLGRLSG